MKEEIRDKMRDAIARAGLQRPLTFMGEIAHDRHNRAIGMQ